MAEHAIPIDLYNPGQVFACMGLLEAADILLGDAEGGFDWSDRAKVIFGLRAKGTENPVAIVLEFLATTSPRRWAPRGFADNVSDKGEAVGIEDDRDGGETEASIADAEEPSATFPAASGDRMSLPIRIGGGILPVRRSAGAIAPTGQNSLTATAQNTAMAKEQAVRDRRSHCTRPKRADFSCRFNICTDGRPQFSRAHG